MNEKAYTATIPAIDEGSIGVVWARTPGQAKHITALSAQDANYRVNITHVRVNRAPEFDDYDGPYRKRNACIRLDLMQQSIRDSHRRESP